MRHTVLIIEDDDDIRDLTQLILEDMAYTVLAAASGEEGLQLLDQHAVDLVVLDIMLPGIDGWETCRRLRGNPATADILIVIFTVRSERQDCDRVEQNMINAFLNKPFDRQEFLTVIDQLLTDNKVMVG